MTKHPSKGRSIVTNGRRLFMVPVQDGAEFRRFADLLAKVEAERGGREAMTVTQQEAARQFVALSVAMERLHAELAAGRPVNLEDLGQLGDRADRQARRMGPPIAVKQSVRDQLLQRAGKR